MHGCQHQVPGFGRAQGQANGFKVAQLADHDHVRVLAQRTAQPLSKAATMAPHLTLVDQAALAGMDDLDRVFQGDDVQRLLAVQLVEQRRQRAGLATAGRPAHEDQAIPALRNSLKHIRKVQLTHRRNAPRNQPKGNRRAIQLAKQVQPKAPKRRQLQRKVHFIALGPLPALVVIQHARHALVQGTLAQGRQAHTLQLAIQAQHRNLTRRQVQV
ncbi:hypothetical protein D9M71_572810 [compost metagenome]